MGLLDSRTRSVVGLDIEPGFLAAAEFSGGGSPSLVRAATESLGPGLFHEGEVVDVDGLADRVKAFFREHDLPKRIRLGVASQKIALRVLELPAIDNEQELEAAIRFQAQEELPMPLEQAVLDYHVLERSTTARAAGCASSSWAPAATPSSTCSRWPARPGSSPSWSTFPLSR